jgi:hypothetical protein
MTKAIQQSVKFKASPETLFDMYLDSKKHSAATGAPGENQPESRREIHAVGQSTERPEPADCAKYNDRPGVARESLEVIRSGFDPDSAFYQGTGRRTD